MSRFPINFRAFLIIAVSTVCVILCAYAYTYSRMLGIILFCVLLAVIVSATAVFTVKFIHKTAKLRVVITFAIASVLGISAFSFATAYYDKWEENLGYGGYREVVGRVCAVDVSTGDYRIDLENLRFDGGKASGILRVKLSVSVNNIAEIVECGDELSFGAYISAIKFVDNGKVNGLAYRSDIRYYATVSSDNITVKFGKSTAIERLTTALRKIMTDNMGDHYGNIAFSMITGDKHALDTNIVNYFSAAGIGHIMAVSGLHIGFMILLLNLIMSKADKRIRFPVISAFLIMYAVIADFSPSVVRAIIMAEISMLAPFVGGRRDILSSLLCAFSIILAVKPFYLFETGFLLSFGAIFGIAMFSDAISRFLVSHKAHRKVAEGIATAVSVEIGVTPTLIYYFHIVQPLAAIVNIVVIPYVSVVFIAIVCFAPIAAIPSLGAIMLPCKYLLMPIDSLAYGISQVPYSEITVYATAGVFLCYPIMFFMSGYYMTEKGKTVIAVYSAAICLALCLIDAPQTSGVTVAMSAGNESVITDNGTVCVVGEMDDAYAVRDALIRSRCKKVDGIYLLKLDSKTVDAIIDLKRTFDISAVYYYEFDDSAVRLIENGINFNLVPDESEIAAAYFCGEIIGYEYKGMLFAEAGTDEHAYSVYDIVRVPSVEMPFDGVVYLCNISEYADKNIYTLENGMYTYNM